MAVTLTPGASPAWAGGHPVDAGCGPLSQSAGPEAPPECPPRGAAVSPGRLPAVLPAGTAAVAQAPTAYLPTVVAWRRASPATGCLTPPATPRRRTESGPTAPEYPPTASGVERRVQAG